MKNKPALGNAKITVAVPATTANLGPGFDCLGAALTLHNQFAFIARSDAETSPVIHVTGPGAEKVGTDADNLVHQAFVQVFQHLNQPPPAVQIDIALGVPAARGLGSSATAIVGGLVGANALAGFPLDQTAIMQMAVAIEGHPDNVVPALLGGCRLAATGIDRDWEICDIPWHPDVIPVVAIPDFELSTQAARAVLPTSYSRADAIFNTAHLGLLLRGLASGKGEWLTAALQDRIHQPYRQSLIPDYAAVRTAALAAGAYGMVISGAGPTLLALADPTTAAAVQAAMADAWTAAGVKATVRVTALNQEGAIANVQVIPLAPPT